MTKQKQKKEKNTGKNHNQTSKNKRERRTTTNNRRVLEVAPKEIKENEIIKILSNPDMQFNPKTVSNTIATPEWGIKPRQIYEAQRIRTVERARIWVREVIRKSKREDFGMGTQNKVIVPIYDVIDEAYVWSWAEMHGESGEWVLGSLQHTEKE